MSFSSKYTIQETLYESASTSVYRAINRKDGSNVIVKTLKTAVKDENYIAAFTNELQMLSLLRSDNIAKIIDSIHTPSEHIHIFEDIGGKSLDEYLKEGDFSFDEALDIAIELTKTVLYLFSKNVIHTAINPKNIIYNRETRKLRLIDFGFALIDNRYRATLLHSSKYIDNVLYTAPEQTGKTVNKIDHRSDLYSLGMTLYHLFSGEIPFSGLDHEDLIHKHLASVLPSLHELKHHIPRVISAIVHKLIEKKSEHRYQSAEAVLYDLEKCQLDFLKMGEIVNFEIATIDRPAIIIGEHLYGRENEVNILGQMVTKALSPSSTRVLVSGASGVGKTRLAEEFIMQLYPLNAYVIRSKFDQYRTAFPYAAFHDIFEQLTTGWLSRKEGKKVPLDSNSASVLHQVFPELKPILPKESQDAKYSNYDFHHQLLYAVNELFNFLVVREFPIVLFIDDLQWADQSSMELIAHLLESHSSPYFHFIANFREAEIQRNNWAFEFVNQLQKPENKGVRLHLEPLSPEKIHQMICGLFDLDDTKSKDFSSIVDKKTSGNPFFLKTFLEHLIKSDILTYERGKWKYSIEEIAQSSISINMGQLIKEKFDRLSKEEKQYLQYLSLWGNSGNLKDTFDAMTSFHLLNSHMKQLDKHGFIEILNGKYRFIHDQIQQYVYLTLTTEMKRKIHLLIGQYMDHKFRDDNRDIIAIVTHLNKGYVTGKFPKKLYVMNIDALEIMLQRNAYIRALREIRWMEANDFDTYLNQKNQLLGFRLGILKARTFYLNGEFQEAEDHILKMMDVAKTIDQQYACFQLYKDLCVTKGTGFMALLDYAVSLCSAVGLQVPKSADETREAVAHLQQNIVLHPKYSHYKDQSKFTTVKNTLHKRVMELLVEAWEVAYYRADVELMQWMYLNIIKYSLQYGYCSASAFGYVLYGGWLVSQGEYKQGYEFGQLALRINHHFNDAVMLPKVHNFVANFISPYTKLCEMNRPLYEKSLYQSKINGDIVFGTWANFLLHLSNYFSGHSLDQLATDMVNRSTLLLNSGDQKMIRIFTFLSHTVHTLQDNPMERFEEEEQMITAWEREKFYPGLAWYAILKAQNAFLNGAFESGLRYLERHVHSEMNEVIMFPKIRLHFIRALLLLALDRPLSEAQKTVLKQDIEFFDGLNKFAPTSFKFAKLILNAEKDKYQKGVWKTSEMYDQALAEAKKNNNNFAIAIVGLCASRFWQHLGYPDMSTFYQNEAILGLKQWGAYALADTYRKIRDTKSLNADEVRKQEDDYNYKTLVKSFITLSKMTDKKEVIHTLLHLIVEHATASRAVLIFKENEVFKVYADLDFSRNVTDVISTPLDLYPNIARSMIHYAINTAESIISEEPCKTGKFRNDEYIIKKEPASCIVLPVTLEADVSAVLYLENYDIPTPLSSQSIKTLELLLTQAAILFKNLLLYSESKNAEDELNKAQEISSVGSWKYDSKSKRIEWSAETFRIYDLEPNSMEINYDWFLEHLLPNEQARIRAAVDMALENDKAYDVTHMIITAKGKKKFVHQRAEVFWDDNVQKMAGTIQDITDSKIAEDLIGRLSQVVNQNPFSTIITDTTGKIEYVNPQCLNMTGFLERELVGKKMNIFRSGIHSDSFYAGLWNTISKEKKLWRGTIVNRMKDGNFIDCASTIFPIFDQNHNIVNYVTVQENITERNVKDKLFIMQTRQAQMGEMLSMIAHQWRQPLAVIGTLLNKERVNLVLNDPNVDELMKNFDDIESQVQHLSRTITDFRDFFKPDKEKTRTKNSILLKKTLSLIEHMLKQKNIILTQVHTHDEEYYTYEHEMVQVLLNLIKNAQDAFEDKKISDRKIIVETTQHRGYSIITVEDNAGGISPSVSESLFLPYVTTKNEHNGTGLGLYMSKTIVEDHCQGQLTFQNTSDGAKFTVKIPLKAKYD